MKQLVIISGKGGTGKTSITASFVSLSPNIVACDCDVDAADLHLLLNPKIQKKEDFQGSKVAIIDPDKCTECGVCEKHCRFDAIINCRVLPDKCEGCAVCQAVCPEDAINFLERVVGEVFTSNTRYGPFFHGRLFPGAANSGKMVTQIRKLAFDAANKEKAELIIIDGSPGIGCPVIASLAGTDMALIITEPTISGIHDLKRIMDVAVHFNIPYSVLVNKHDINKEHTKAIETLCKERNIPIIGRIPFDPVITKSMVAGKPVVEYTHNGVSDIIKEAWQNINKELSK